MKSRKSLPVHPRPGKGCAWRPRNSGLWICSIALVLMIGASGPLMGQGKAVLTKQSDREILLDYYPAIRPLDTVIVGGTRCVAFANALGDAGESTVSLPVERVAVGIPPLGLPTVELLSVDRIPERSLPLAVRLLAFGADSTAGVRVARAGSDIRLVGTEGPAVTVSKIYWLRGQRIAELEIRPWSCDQSGSGLREMRRAQIAVRFPSSAGPGTSSGDDPGFEAVFKSILVNYQQARKWRKAESPSGGVAALVRATAVDSTRSWFDPAKRYIKIFVGADGLYALRYEDFQSHGLLSPAGDPHKAEVYYKGNPVPLRVVADGNASFDPGESLEFYGRSLKDEGGSPDEYSDTSAYWLTFDDAGSPSVPVGLSPAAAGDTVRWYWEPARMETDSIYYFGDGGLPSNNQTGPVNGEGWYWRQLFGGKSTSVPFTVSNLDSTAAPQALLTIRFHSVVASQNTPDHRIDLFVNGAQIGQAEFNGYATIVARIPFSSSRLHEGINSVTARSEVTASSVNEVMFDWALVTYPRWLAADSDKLFFAVDSLTAGTVRTFSVNGFSAAESLAYCLDQRGMIEKVIQGTGFGSAGLFGVSFTDTLRPGRSYVLLSEQRKPAASRMEAATFTDLRAQVAGADYLIVTHSSLLGAAQRLAQYRQQRGIGRVVVVRVGDIYDQFNYGHASPVAIRSFLRAVDTLWAGPAPSMVLFFGDANWDYKDNLKTGKTNLVPSYGNPASDAWFVESPQSSLLPTKCIGRIPARTTAEAEFFVDRIIAYESAPLSLWNKRFMFMASGWDSLETLKFQNFSNNLIQQYITASPVAGLPSRIYRTTSQVIEFEATEETKRAIDDGALWINYYGHAGTELWGNGITSPDQLANTQNRVHVLSDISCSTARFAEPLVDAFGEKFLFAGSGGAIAYFGSSGFGYESPLRSLASSTYKEIAQDSIRFLGELLLASKVALWQQGSGSLINQEALQQFTLLGDPATELALPRSPDYALEDQTQETIPARPADSDSSVSIVVPVFNYGLKSADSLRLSVEHRKPDQTAESLELTVPPLGSVDTVLVNAPSLSEAGAHQLDLRLNPQGTIPELDEGNNDAEFTYFVSSSRILAIAPPPLSVLHADSVKVKIQNTLQQTSASPFAFFEIDTSSSFTGSGVLRSGPVASGVGSMSISWKVPPAQLGEDRSYHWRGRVVMGADSTDWVGGEFRTSATERASWSQATDEQFAANRLEHLLVDAGVRLLRKRLPVEVYSAGFSDGLNAVITVNGVNVSLGYADRGYNIAVINPESGELESYAAFSIYSEPGDTSKALPLVQFLQSIPYGRRVLVAIADEGSVSKSESLNQQLEMLGSAQIRNLRFRDSWALIGWKGATPGSVPEELRRSGTGPVTLRDTLQIAAQSGTMTGAIVGPFARVRKVAVVSDSVSATSQLTVGAIRTLRNGSVDTVWSGSPDSLRFELGDTARSLSLVAQFASDTTQHSPVLRSWSVEYDPPPELLVAPRTSDVVPETALEGTDLALTVRVHNVGEGAAAGIPVSISYRSQGLADPVAQFVIPSLGVDSVYEYRVAVATRGHRGAGEIVLQIDSAHALTELSEANNVASLPVFVQRDTVPPTFNVTFDGVSILDGDYVSATPEVRIGIQDNSPLPITDPANVVLRLDGRRVELGAWPDSLFTAGTGGEKAEVLYKPTLSKGEHLLSVEVLDATGNASDTLSEQLHFRVEPEAQLLNVVNIPNPFVRQTTFTFNLVGTRIPDELTIRIYTVAGRRIQEIRVPQSDLRFGFNQVRWDGRDRDGQILANGVYFYKLAFSLDGKQVETIEKMAKLQ